MGDEALSMTVHVDPSIARELRRLAVAYPEALMVALYEEMVEVMRESNRRAPFGEGELRDSNYVAAAKSGSRVEAGYGAAYAVVQHERTDFKHDRGEAKFLQRAVDSRSSGMLERIGKRVDALVQKGNTPGMASEFPSAPPSKSTKTKKRTKRSRVRKAAAQLKGRRRGRGS